MAPTWIQFCNVMCSLGCRKRSRGPACSAQMSKKKKRVHRNLPSLNASSRTVPNVWHCNYKPVIFLIFCTSQNSHPSKMVDGFLMFKTGKISIILTDYKNTFTHENRQKLLIFFPTSLSEIRLGQIRVSKKKKEDSLCSSSVNQCP